VGHDVEAAEHRVIFYGDAVQAEPCEAVAGTEGAMTGTGTMRIGRS
jgi:hypothetical protein